MPFIIEQFDKIHVCIRAVVVVGLQALEDLSTNMDEYGGDMLNLKYQKGFPSIIDELSGADVDYKLQKGLHQSFTSRVGLVLTTNSRRASSSAIDELIRAGD
jgi:hypothetical protein